MTDPIQAAAAITNDTAFALCRAIYVGVGGDIVVKFANGSTATFKNVQTGELLVVQAIMVVGAGTTATNCLACY